MDRDRANAHHLIHFSCERSAIAARSLDSNEGAVACFVTKRWALATVGASVAVLLPIAFEREFEQPV
jgi:hypothetical protein